MLLVWLYLMYGRMLIRIRCSLYDLPVQFSDSATFSLTLSGIGRIVRQSPPFI